MATSLLVLVGGPCPQRVPPLPAGEGSTPTPTAGARSMGPSLGRTQGTPPCTPRGESRQGRGLEASLDSASPLHLRADAGVEAPGIQSLRPGERVVTARLPPQCSLAMPQAAGSVCGGGVAPPPQRPGWAPCPHHGRPVWQPLLSGTGGSRAGELGGCGLEETSSLGTWPVFGRNSGPCAGCS